MVTIIKSLNKWKTVLYLFFAVLYSCQGLALSFIIQVAGRTNFKNPNNILYFGLFGIFLFVFIYVCMYIDNILLQSIIKDFNIKISEKALKSFYWKSLNYSEDELNSFLIQDITLFWQQYLASLLVFPIWSFSIIASSFYLILQNISIGILFIIGGLLMIIPQFVFNTKLKEAGEEFNHSREISLANISDYSKGISTIRANQAGESFSHFVTSSIKNTEKKQYHFYTLHNLVMFWTGPLKGIGLVIPFILALLYSNISLTTLIAMMTASANLISPLQQLLNASSSIQSTNQLKNKIIFLLSLPEKTFKNSIQTSAPLTLQVNKVSKSYHSKIILDSIDLTVLPHKHILITGSSGSGKSTLFNLLTAEDTVDEGKIQLITSKQEIFSPSYDFISIIHQSPYIFKASLRDNLCFYQNISDNHLKHVLQQVNLWNVFPKNLDHQLDGKNISGGQAMKIEIARSLIKQKTILLADEITASLDKDSALDIRKVIKGLPISIIEIAHHYENSDYDDIYELQNHKLIKVK